MGGRYVHFEIFLSPSVRFLELWIMFFEQMKGLRFGDISQLFN